MHLHAPSNQSTTGLSESHLKIELFCCQVFHLTEWIFLTLISLSSLHLPAIVGLCREVTDLKSKEGNQGYKDVRTRRMIEGSVMGFQTVI